MVRDVATTHQAAARRQGSSANARPGRTQRRVIIESDDEEDTLSEKEHAEQDGPAKGRKRARLNRDGDSRPSIDPEQDEDRERPGTGDIAKEPGRRQTHPRDVDGYIPGSIVRIQLRNFMSYDYTEFSPGPYLNMIIGPNGTGKSSVACAIALGLNFAPNILGRSNDIRSFVKKAERIQEPDKRTKQQRILDKTGHIEIELKGIAGKSNVTIRRDLDSETKTTSFTMNRRTASGKEVTTKIEQLGIQVGNLCSFLPQDRVSEFAAMSPEKLLKETQRAAGDEHLTSWHDTLISAGKELRVIETQLASDQEALQQKRQRNEAIAREVELWNERARLENEIALLGALKLVERYRELKLASVQANDARKKAHAIARGRERRGKHWRDLQRRLEADHKDLTLERKQKTENNNSLEGNLRRTWKKLEDLGAETEKTHDKLSEISDEAKARQANIAKLEEQLKKQKDMEAAPVDLEDAEALKAQLESIKAAVNNVRDRKVVVEDEIRVNIDQCASLESRAERIERRISALNTEAGKQFQKLADWDRNTADVVTWLRKNQDRFKMPILEPAILSLKVPDQRYAAAVEACINRFQIRTFVAQCHEDYDLFNELIQDKGKETIGRNVSITAWYRDLSKIAVLPAPMTPEELKEHNFDGYVLDFVECPEALRGYLRAELNLHRTAVALNANRVNVNKIMDFHTQSSGNGANFITGKTLHQVSKSRYGRKAVQNVTRHMKEARNLASGSVDAARITRLNNELRQLRRDAEKCDIEQAPMKDNLAEIQKEERELGVRGNDLKARQQVLREDAKRRQKLKAQIRQTETKLTTQRAYPPPEAEKARLKATLLELARRQAVLTKECVVLGRRILDNNRDATVTGLRKEQAKADLMHLNTLCERKDQRLQQAWTVFRRAEDEHQRLKEAATAKFKEWKRFAENLPEDVGERHQDIIDIRAAYDKAIEAGTELEVPAEQVELRSFEQLDVDLATAQAQFDLNTATNGAVVETFERRKREIEELEASIEAKERNTNRINRQIRLAKDSWKPALETLVKSIGDKFSAAFDRIGCAGEIRIREHEDYEQWAIDILVKFRDAEPLQLLTGQRQSGGERSLTTILYLMSLTEQARAPFSLVDEINQGMDQRAERAVHDNLVEVTCREDSAQCFLITPKLLADLTYHERMKILCVNNGEWLPPVESRFGNMMGFLDAYVATRAGAGPAQ